MDKYTNSDELVSVLLPVLNSSDILRNAISSVLRQTYKNFELIVINDGSTEDLSNVINMFNDERIVFINRKENKGVAYSLNEGLETAQGSMIARIDADDVWIDEDKLLKQVKILNEDRQVVLVGSRANFIKNGNKLFTFPNNFSDEEIRKNILFKNQFVHSSVLFRKQNWKYSEKWDRVQDYELWLRMGKTGTFKNTDDIVVEYKILPNSETSSHRAEMVDLCIKLLEKHKDSYPGYYRAFIKWHILKVLISLKRRF